MGAFRLIAKDGMLFRDHEKYAIVHRNQVLIRVKYALLTDIDYLMLASNKHRVLGTLALGRIVDRGVDVPKSFLNKNVILGPKCSSKIYVKDIEGVASSYVVAPVSCVKETRFNDPYVLLAPCFRGIASSGKSEYILKGKGMLWGFNPTPLLKEKAITYVCCLNFYENLTVNEEVLLNTKKFFKVPFFSIEENDLVKLKEALMENIVFVTF